MEIPRGKSETTGAPRSAIRRDEASTGALTYVFYYFWSAICGIAHSTPCSVDGSTLCTVFHSNGKTAVTAVVVSSMKEFNFEILNLSVCVCVLDSSFSKKKTGNTEQCSQCVSHGTGRRESVWIEWANAFRFFSCFFFCYTHTHS